MSTQRLITITETKNITAIKNDTVQISTYNGTFITGQLNLNNINVNKTLENVPYSPSNPGKWANTPPTTVSEALNRLAALENNAIP